jgi:tRNA(fMet)-specific endonuclease VapC
MKYLLDTDHISILQKQSGAEYATLLQHMAMVPLSEFAFSIVSFHEQVLGCQTYLARARTRKDVIRGYRLLDHVLDAFASSVVLSFDDPAASVFDSLMSQRVRIANL